MKEQDYINYRRIEKAINYIKSNFIYQPSLKETAEHVNLSPFHFQRLFTDWAGVSPKKFLQYLSVEYAKQILDTTSTSLFDTAHETGLSGTSRLHDLFVTIEGMTPGEYKSKGDNLNINYSYHNTIFGEILIASTSKGICYMGFSDDEGVAFSSLTTRFPNATFSEQQDSIQKNALLIYTQDWSQISKIKLHLKGTDFQLKVWQTLLKIPTGDLTTYGSIAKQINKPKASRAVGTAIGSNPIAFLIPCHRVIQSTGSIGGYMWGTDRKSALIGWEASKVNV